MGGRRRVRSRAAKSAIGLSLLGLLALLTAPACGGVAQNPVASDPSELACLVTLEADCCPTGITPPTCLAQFAAAETCASWPAETTVAVFATPCDGFTAIRTHRPTDTFASFYLYDASGKLYAIGDDATEAGVIECGAGPSRFVVAAACTTAWLEGGTACLAGTASPSSVCR